MKSLGCIFSNFEGLGGHPGPTVPISIELDHRVSCMCDETFNLVKKFSLHIFRETFILAMIGICFTIGTLNRGSSATSGVPGAI